jgi:MOSC domain-containing protein YiiM
MRATVVAVSRARDHTFSKSPRDRIMLLAGLGVDGDAHAGVTVQHRSRVRRDPTQPNLRQVHLIATELLDELGRSGYRVAAGDLGENVTTTGVDLLGLPTGTLLRLGDRAVVAITGLRNPCRQIDDFADGLLKLVLGRDRGGNLIRRAGVMGVVITGGPVRAGDPIGVDRPPGVPRPLPPV